jgi:hypothetical protein
MIKVIVPIHWTVWRKKVFLWLNFYRNAHFQILSKLKREYKESLYKYLHWQKLQTPISITYTFHPSRKGQDLDNSIAVQAKFFQDSLIEYWVIENDDYESIPVTHNMVWIKDKEWYIEIVVQKLDSK